MVGSGVGGASVWWAGFGVVGGVWLVGVATH